MLRKVTNRYRLSIPMPCKELIDIHSEDYVIFEEIDNVLYMRKYKKQENVTTSDNIRKVLSNMSINLPLKFIKNHNIKVGNYLDIKIDVLNKSLAISLISLNKDI